MECSGVLPTTMFAYRKGQGPCDALFYMSHTLQNALESGQEAWIVQIDYSTSESSKLVDVLSGVLQGRVLSPLLLILCTSELFSIPENELIGYGDDSTLMAVVPSPGARVTVAESLMRDLCRVSEWCDLLGMKLNASKTKTFIVSRPCTMHYKSPPITIGRTVLKESDDLIILGVTLIPR